MPEDDPITDPRGVTDRAPVSETPAADKEAVTEPPDADAQNAAAKPSIDALFLYDASLGAAFPTALRDVSYPAARMVPISDWADIRAALSRYGRIGTLVFYTHSTPGELAIAGSFPSETVQRETLAASRVKVTNDIVFEGCSIMADPARAVRMVSGIAEPSTRVSGYTYYGISQVIPVTLDGSESLAEVQARFDAHGGFLLPIGPSPESVVGEATSFTLYKRWFRQEYDASHLPDLSGGGSLGALQKYVKRADELVPITVSTAQAAEALRAGERTTPQAYRVTVDDIQAVIGPPAEPAR